MLEHTSPPSSATTMGHAPLPSPKGASGASEVEPASRGFPPEIPEEPMRSVQLGRATHRRRCRSCSREEEDGGLRGDAVPSPFEHTSASRGATSDDPASNRWFRAYRSAEPQGEAEER